MGRPRKTLEERFWEKVDKEGPIHLELKTPSWKWKAYKIGGYGSMGGHNFTKNELAHRVSWKIHYGEIPKEMDVLHHCDVHECTNPIHLFLSTHADNMQDMSRKGRQRTLRGDQHYLRKHPEKVSRGSSNKNSKLNEESVKEIRYFRLNRNLSTANLSQMYEVSESTILQIINRKTWKHI